MHEVDATVIENRFPFRAETFAWLTWHQRVSHVNFNLTRINKVKKLPYLFQFHDVNNTVDSQLWWTLHLYIYLWKITRLEPDASFARLKHNKTPSGTCSANEYMDGTQDKIKKKEMHNKSRTFPVVEAWYDQG